MELTPADRPLSSGSVEAPSDRLVSKPGVTALRSALQALLRRGWADGELRRAVGIISTEARQRGLLPEQLLVSLKEAWYSLPEVRGRTRGIGYDVMLERLVSETIRAYYAPPTAAGATDAPLPRVARRGD